MTDRRGFLGALAALAAAPFVKTSWATFPHRGVVQTAAWLKAIRSLA